MKYISPQRDAGKLTLKNGRNLWLYDPTSQVSIPISPQQRLLGQASNGDVITSNWAHDYNAKIIGVESIKRRELKNQGCFAFTSNFP
ncbi:outer membrane lipoprotein-sorting protein [Pantoea rodasii]|uniref:outer membrane lipoprotein-sorting protein n=1 Tax=Pantoea rodasii TaxID=1076549 RepID=UPI0024533184|nr:outer membrane lipoprotein-sorting protein [Pantoea rodasii]